MIERNKKKEKGNTFLYNVLRRINVTYVAKKKRNIYGKSLEEFWREKFSWEREGDVLFREGLDPIYIQAELEPAIIDASIFIQTLQDFFFFFFFRTFLATQGKLIGSMCTSSR